MSAATPQADETREVEARRPVRREPRPRESVVFNSFWRRPEPIYHARHDPGTICDPENGAGREPCGHAMPIELADKIGRPCRKCYVSTSPASAS